MSFRYAQNKCLSRDCGEPAPLCREPCEPCCDEFKCLLVEHWIVEACPPSRLAQITEKVAMTPALALLPPISYTVELRFTNQSQNTLRLEHVYSSLALESKWSSIEVRALTPECSIAYPLVVDGDLLGNPPTDCTGATATTYCIGPCESLSLVICLVGHCYSPCDSAQPVLGGLACTVLNDHLVICATQPCCPTDGCVPSTIRKRHEISLPT